MSFILPFHNPIIFDWLEHSKKKQDFDDVISLPLTLRMTISSFNRSSLFCSWMGSIFWVIFVFKPERKPWISNWSEYWILTYWMTIYEFIVQYNIYLINVHWVVFYSREFHCDTDAIQGKHDLFIVSYVSLFLLTHTKKDWLTLFRLTKIHIRD